MKKICFSFIVLNSFLCFSQDFEYTTFELLHKIELLQQKGDGLYAYGSFASKRISRKGKKQVDDNNIFFTALIAYTLKSHKDNVLKELQVLTDSIVERAKQSFQYYENRNGDITYNFWRTKPEMPMPNSQFWSKKDRFLLADDLDDTSLIYLILGENSKQDTLLKQKIAFFANKDSSPLISTLKTYQNYGAYFTWFGEKMKQDVDICIASNVLLFVFHNNFILNNSDYETIRFIIDIVKNDDHLKYPHIISPWYQNKAIILYNVSRLLAEANYKALDEIRADIKADIKAELKNNSNRMEKLLLQTSLLRLGYKVNEKIPLDSIEDEFAEFHFFYINPFAGYSAGVKKMTGPRNLAYYYSEAYYWTLVYEYLVLWDKYKME